MEAKLTHPVFYDQPVSYTILPICLFTIPNL